MAGDSRYQLLSQPVQAPGCCFNCKSASGGPFIDCGFSIKWEGAIIICATCLRDMYNQLPVEVTEAGIEAEDKSAEDFRQGYEKAMEEVTDEFVKRFADFGRGKLAPSGPTLFDTP